jgi:hypothetical protein
MACKVFGATRRTRYISNTIAPDMILASCLQVVCKLRSLSRRLIFSHIEKIMNLQILNTSRGGAKLKVDGYIYRLKERRDDHIVFFNY